MGQCMWTKKKDYEYKALSKEDFNQKEELLTGLGITFFTTGEWFLVHISESERRELTQEYGMILISDKDESQ